jgi:hypothetical protein
MGSGRRCSTIGDVGRPFEPVAGGVRVDLPASVRDLLRQILPQLRDVLEGGDASRDPALARMFPAAYPDDPLRSLEFETSVGSELLRERLDAIRTMEGSLDADRLSDEQLLAWHATVNGLRLVLGTRIGITEDVSLEEVSDDDRPAFELYHDLTALEAWIVDVLPLGT